MVEATQRQQLDPHRGEVRELTKERSPLAMEAEHVQFHPLGIFM